MLTLILLLPLLTISSPTPACGAGRRWVKRLVGMGHDLFFWTTCARFSIALYTVSFIALTYPIYPIVATCAKKIHCLVRISIHFLAQSHEDTKAQRHKDTKFFIWRFRDFMIWRFFNPSITQSPNHQILQNACATLSHFCTPVLPTTETPRHKGHTKI